MPLFVGGAGSPSNTMSPGPRPTSVPSGILIHSLAENGGATAKGGELLCPISLGRKVRAAEPPLGELGPHLTQFGLGRCAHLLTKWHPNPFNRWATIHQRYRQDR